MSELYARGFTEGAEGPSCDFDGSVYAVDYLRTGTIGRVGPGGKAEVFFTLPQGSVGCGTCLGRDGGLYIADYTGHNILRLDLQDKSLRCFVHQPAMTQPNDIVETAGGLFFASDPDWKAGTGRLWRCARGRAELAEDHMGTANGVELSPDERVLYVNETVQRTIWAYDVSPEGALSDKRLFASFADFGLDGMACDCAGHLFAVRFGKGTVAEFAPDGTLLREIPLQGKNCTNIAFGGPDGRTAYVTLSDTGCIETFPVETPGRLWAREREK